MLRLEDNDEFLRDLRDLGKGLIRLLGEGFSGNRTLSTLLYST